jgi:hypothetical protein
MNFSGGSGLLPPPIPFASMLPMAPALSPCFSASSMMPMMGSQMPMMGSQMPMMGSQMPSCDPGFHSHSCRRPARICRRRSRRSRRHRPVMRVSESSSCSSLSTCSTISSCSPRRRRSRSHSRRYGALQPQQQQQPIILLPIQQSAPAAAVSGVNQMQQPQPQQIVLPPISVQQPGQYQSQQFQPQQFQPQQFQPQQYQSQQFQPQQFQQQQLALPQISGQLQQQLALPAISYQQPGAQYQQQPLALSPIQMNSCNLLPAGGSNPVIPSGQPMIQQSLSLPQIANIGQTQQIQPASVQYIQAIPQSSAPLQYISAEPRSTIAPQRVLVNSTNKKPSVDTKPAGRSPSTRTVPQNDLKFGRRPFDWYNDKKKNILNENIQIGQRGNTSVK